MHHKIYDQFYPKAITLLKHILTLLSPQMLFIQTTALTATAGCLIQLIYFLRHMFPLSGRKYAGMDVYRCVRGMEQLSSCFSVFIEPALS